MLTVAEFRKRVKKLEEEWEVLRHKEKELNLLRELKALMKADSAFVLSFKKSIIETKYD